MISIKMEEKNDIEQAITKHQQLLANLGQFEAQGVA